MMAGDFYKLALCLSHTDGTQSGSLVFSCTKEGKKGEEGEKEASFCDSEKPQGLQEETHVAFSF